MLENTWSSLLLHTQSLLVAAAFFVVLEYLIPATRWQKKWRGDSALDLAYSYLLPVLLAPARMGMMIFLAGSLLGQLPTPGLHPDGPTLQQFLKVAPDHGTVEFDSDGNFTYTPEPGFFGMENIVIQRTDGRNRVVQTFLVKISPGPRQTFSTEPAKPIVQYAEVSKVVSGEVTEGVSGVFFTARQFINQQNVWAQLFLAIFLVDFVGYWRHRWMHTRLLWPFHAIHHSPQQLDWLSNERFHPVNTHISYLLSLTVMTAFFKEPFVFALAMPLRHYYGMFLHANVKLSFGPLSPVFASPLFHHWHHSDGEIANKNYATFFSGFDFLFGTYYLPSDKTEPTSLGLPQGAILRPNLWTQFIYPFIELFNMFRKKITLPLPRRG